jgi:hypothetical protein
MKNEKYQMENGEWVFPIHNLESIQRRGAATECRPYRMIVKF